MKMMPKIMFDVEMHIKRRQQKYLAQEPFIGGLSVPKLMTHVDPIYTKNNSNSKHDSNPLIGFKRSA